MPAYSKVFQDLSRCFKMFQAHLANRILLSLEWHRMNPHIHVVLFPSSQVRNMIHLVLTFCTCLNTSLQIDLQHSANTCIFVRRFISLNHFSIFLIPSSIRSITRSQPISQRPAAVEPWPLCMVQQQMAPRCSRRAARIASPAVALWVISLWVILSSLGVS